MRRNIFLGLADLALLLLAFFLVHLFNYGNLNISEVHQQLFKYQILAWLAVSLALISGTLPIFSQTQSV